MDSTLEEQPSTSATFPPSFMDFTYEEQPSTSATLRANSPVVVSYLDDEAMSEGDGVDDGENTANIVSYLDNSDDETEGNVLCMRLCVFC